MGSASSPASLDNRYTEKPSGLIVKEDPDDLRTLRTSSNEKVNAAILLSVRSGKLGYVPLSRVKNIIKIIIKGVSLIMSRCKSVLGSMRRPKVWLRGQGANYLSVI